MSAVISLADEVGAAAACRALRMPRIALYRDRAVRRTANCRPRLQRRGGARRWHFPNMNSVSFSTCSIAPRFVNCAPARSMLNCSMKGAPSPRCARCTTRCKAVPRCTNAAINCPSGVRYAGASGRHAPIRCRAGTSRN